MVFVSAPVTHHLLLFFQSAQTRYWLPRACFFSCNEKVLALRISPTGTNQTSDVIFIFPSSLIPRHFSPSPNHHSSAWNASFAWKMCYLWSTFVSDTGWVIGSDFFFFQEGSAVTLSKQIGYWVTWSDSWGGRSSSCTHPRVLYQTGVVWIHNGWSLVFNIDWTVCVCECLGILWIIWMRPHLNLWMRDYSKKPLFLSRLKHRKHISGEVKVTDGMEVERQNVF